MARRRRRRSSSQGSGKPPTTTSAADPGRELLAAGREALDGFDYELARQRFEQALADTQSAEAAAALCDLLRRPLPS